MYQVNVIYTDESVFTLDGVGQYTAVGMVKDALGGVLSSEDKDVEAIYVTIASSLNEAPPED